MIKTLLSFVFIFSLISCKSNTVSANYLGQPYPNSIPVIFAPDIISKKGRLEHGISFTPDTQEVAFGILNKDDYSGQILYSKKIDENWITPIIFKSLKGESVFLPYFSPDGKSMLFAKNRSNANNGITDIWILNKNRTIWNHPKKINIPISTLSREASACLTLDNTIYFSSNRDGNGLANLYFSSLDSGQYLNTERINSISSARDEESIFVSPNADYIIFSRYVTNKNGPDLFISYKDSQKKWIKPTVLDSTINTLNWERRPFISIDNKFMFFTKLTLNHSGIVESDIYWVNTEKIFKPFVFNPIIKKVIKVGKKTALEIPSDYFKDIDNEKLTINFNNQNTEWAIFDKEKMILIINPVEIGEYDLVFTAVDKFSNQTNDKIKIIVKK
ncbi:hypothetical protein [uncultured Algibacter sp.]|uniref:TolB family protein n=1 Tax=uncultured Algibacter sp. TaxID=298659 RepID=UPI003217D947